MALTKYLVPYQVLGTWYHPIIPYHTLTISYPYHTLPYPTIPYHILPYPIIPYPTLPYPILSYPTLPYPTLSYPITTMSYPILP